MKKVWRVGYWMILVVLIVIAGLIGLSTVNIPGGYNLYVVQSGSMEPAIKRMGVVVVQPVDEYKEGDIITIQESPNSNVTVTHRIFEIENTDEGKLYTLKGDANEDPDGEKRTEGSILGKVIFTVPYLGYPVSFAKTQTGFILLVIIPAVIIIYSEVLSIKNEVQKIIRRRKGVKKKTEETKKYEK